MQGNAMLTDLSIKKLPVPPKRREVPDRRVTGLYLILQPSGAKSWALRYRAAGKPTKLTLGPYPAIDLAAARKKAQEAIGDIASGGDPAAQKKASRAAARASHEANEDLVERVVDLFIERYAKRKTKDWRETAAMLNREVVGRWKGRRLSQITRAHVHQMLDEIVDRGAPIAANRRYAAFRKMCSWAVERGIIDRNPCDGVKAPAAETGRDRVLGDDELKAIWQACERIGVFGPLVRLLALTGARLREVAGMEWSELDLGARTWTLPKERTKNKRAHVVPLSDAATQIIESLPRIQDQRFLFSGTGRTPVSGFSKMKDKLDDGIQALRANDTKPLPEWVIHDLRRTVATNLQRLGVRLEVTEAVLNHVGGSRAGIVGIYQRHDWANEKRAALDAWARKLEAIVNGAAASNVVELAAARS